VFGFGIKEAYIYGMSKRSKLYASAIFVFMALPIVTAFCCCLETNLNQSRQEMLGHHKSGGSEKGHSSHHSGGSEHDHSSHHQQTEEGTPAACECGNEILAGLVNKTSIDFAFAHSFSKIQYVAFNQEVTSPDVESNQNLWFHDVGPPGIHFLSNPSYLISLRI